jgi:hypothetical protein
MLSFLSITAITIFLLPQSLPNTIKVSLGETIDPLMFQSSDPTLANQLESIDISVLSQTTITVNDDGTLRDVIVKVTNEGAVVQPLIGSLPFIAKFAWNDTNQFIEIFNSSDTIIDLSMYQLKLNLNTFDFELNTNLDPFSSNLWQLELGTLSSSPLSLDTVIVIPEGLTSIGLYDILQEEDIDVLELEDVLPTRYGNQALSEVVFSRYNKVIEPEIEWQADSWVVLNNESEFDPHSLFVPVLTPLDQAKAWATDVMFGRGMFAAGRVEEAFRTLEEEYTFMHPLSQALLFEASNTQVSGINERGNQDTSSFREAVGRYNYLAARVPGATSLINPNPEPFPWVILILVSLGVLGLFGVVAYFKSRPVVVTKKE